MDSTNTCAEMLVQQGQNVLTSIKDLQSRAKKEGKERSGLYERYCANQHSFRVYTHMDVTIGQLAEVQAFQQQMQLFDAVFAETRTNLEAEVDVQQGKKSSEDVSAAYNTMVHALRNS